MRTALLLSALGTLAALALAPAGPAATAAGKLSGKVGPDFTISLTSGGKKVTKLKAGTYAFVVADKSSFHNFAVKGPKLSTSLTQVAFTGSKTTRVALNAGTYVFYCVRHPDTMKGTFKVS